MSCPRTATTGLLEANALIGANSAIASVTKYFIYQVNWGMITQTTSAGRPSTAAVTVTVQTLGATHVQTEPR